MADDLKTRVKQLYTGGSRRSVRFRYGLFAFDLATIAYFILVTPLADTPLQWMFNVLISIVIFLDLTARFWIAANRRAHLAQIYVVADIVVLASFVLNPLLHIDLAFLRILRGLRLAHSNYLLRDLRRDWAFFRRNEDAIVALVNLTVFVFVTTSAVFTFFVDTSRGWEGYVDALYYTVTTLTTTGYGDLTPTTPSAKLGAVVVMIVGVALFMNLVRAVFLPSKVRYRCTSCGLSRHEPDAVHCKHCGETIRIETRGFE